MTVLENLRKEYPYLYETHLHTSEASACACSTGKEMAQACKDAGYTGIIVTNHNWHGNHCIDPSLPWENGSANTTVAMRKPENGEKK